MRWTLAIFLLFPVSLSAAQEDLSPIPTRASPPVAPVSPATTTNLLSSSNDPYQPPPTLIQGADKPVKYGKLIDLKVAPITNRPASLYSINYTWSVRPPADDLVVFPDGTQAIFGAGIVDATIDVELIASYVFVDKDAAGVVKNITQRLVLVTKQIQVGKPVPVPPTPDPIVVVPPAPVLPTLSDGKFGLARQVYTWADAVQTTNKKQQAAKLAASFRNAIKAAADLQDDANTSAVEKLMKVTKDGNDEALTDPTAHAAWRAGWFTKLDTTLQGLKSNQKLMDMSSHLAAWDEIATGLEAYSK